MPALVVSIDGPDFSGKTTIANLVIEKLRSKYKGSDIIFLRTELPSILVTGSFTKILRNSADVISPQVFALAYATDHLNHYEKIIKPLKDASEKYVVIQERSSLSMYIYQGLLGNVDINWLDEINKYNQNIPDLTLILVVDEEELLKRMKLEKRGFDKFEQEDFIKKEVRVFYNLPKSLVEKFNVKYVSSDKDPMVVADKCVQKIASLIEDKFK